jgi:serine/threonine protein kinase
MFGLRKVKRFGIELGYDLLMEYLDGHDLGDKVVGRVLSTEDKIKVVFQSVQALDYVHKHKLVHLDIKPSNFMLVKGSVKLIDFGVSVAIGHRANAVTGTGGYLSPEQVCKDVIDEKTDIFALGVTAVYAKRFASMAGTDPDWYSSDIHSFGSSGTTRMVDSVSSMANSIGSTMSSSPSSGSGGGSFSGGGGGGGSGGGSW